MAQYLAPVAANLEAWHCIPCECRRLSNLDGDPLNFAPRAVLRWGSEDIVADSLGRGFEEFVASVLEDKAYLRAEGRVVDTFSEGVGPGSFPCIDEECQIDVELLGFHFFRRVDPNDTLD